jgi:hypothetical protein
MTRTPPPGIAMLDSGTSSSWRCIMAPKPELSDPVESLLVQTLAPLHKRALGLAVGVTASVGVFLLTAFHIVVSPDGAPDILLLSQYFYGYRLTWPGALIGAAWGAVFGFTAGWVFAFTRNFAAMTWLRLVKAKAELLETRDFLDHI